MDYVVLEDVHKAYARRYGAPTLRAHHERAERDRLDRALRGVSLRVPSGDGVAIMSTRRSGRSTLLAVVAGLYRPDSGSVRVHGRVTGFQAMGAGFVSSLPVARNLRVGAALLGMRPSDLEERRPAILEHAGLGDEVLGYPTRDLQGSQRRRLAYSLVLFSRPDVLLADGLVLFGDKKFRQASLDQMKQLRDEGHALVLATHHPTVMRTLCSRAVVMNRGEVAYEGGFRQARRTLAALRAG
jgi:ABC-type polysaccharide/polyol phosphate transport system ATPase subunit